LKKDLFEIFLVQIRKTYSKVVIQEKNKIEKYIPKFLFKDKNKNSGGRGVWEENSSK
jgi:hypothetical protein